MRIYLDHNASSPMRPEVRAACGDRSEFTGNPASIHRSGQRARRALEAARERIARAVDAGPSQIVFTSGGTEANNLAIFGTTAANPARRKIVSSAIEHSSILEPLNVLKERGFEIVMLPVDRNGRLVASAALEGIDDRTALVTLGLANAEVGIVQELATLGELARSSGAMFHVDAAQAFGRIPVSVESPGCDLMTLSAHKIGGSLGTGALYVRDSGRIGPAMFGGPQERGLRAGTPNLVGAVGFGVAAEAVTGALPAEAKRVADLADRLLTRLLDAVPGLMFNGPPRGHRLPNTLSLTFAGVLGESLLMALDLEGVEVSMGSACAAGSVEPSHVLLAMGRTPAEARSSLRISLGWSTTVDEIDRAAEIITRVWRQVADAEPMRLGETAEASR